MGMEGDYRWDERNNMTGKDDGHEEWEKENRPAHWLEYTWKNVQCKLAEIAEVLAEHPELEGTLPLPREEEEEASDTLQ